MHSLEAILEAARGTVEPHWTVEILLGWWEPIITTAFVAVGGTVGAGVWIVGHIMCKNDPPAQRFWEKGVTSGKEDTSERGRKAMVFRSGASCQSLPLFFLVGGLVAVLSGGVAGAVRVLPVTIREGILATGTLPVEVGQQVCYAFLAAWLIGAAATDYYYRRVPNELSALGLLLAAVWLAAGSPALLSDLLAASSVAAGMILIREVSRAALGTPGFGGADVKVAVVMCLVLGWEGLWALYLGCVSVALVGGVVRLGHFLVNSFTTSSGRYAREWEALTPSVFREDVSKTGSVTQMPFVPFVAVGLLLSWFALPLSRVLPLFVYG